MMFQQKFLLLLLLWGSIHLSASAQIQEDSQMEQYLSSTVMQLRASTRHSDIHAVTWENIADSIVTKDGQVGNYYVMHIYLKRHNPAYAQSIDTLSQEVHADTFAMLKVLQPLIAHKDSPLHLSNHMVYFIFSFWGNPEAGSTQWLNIVSGSIGGDKLADLNLESTCYQQLFGSISFQAHISIPKGFSHPKLWPRIMIWEAEDPKGRATFLYFDNDH
ncbi:hypothetical protein PVA45_08470 (plasmid) [Entomospira entomophila]|uniref:Uncharacterized protein n=1 Tax=Entomospira entomophila TaxID=2719988 RepID=A0A968KTJ3_9SPIO|nr:hypothetical protein [Entomospira entomophilus]NIZ41507.1 hypothetical protein [Entomospira entomophilus]WDI36409.1 hypothetical protein PVA45_08470 [Entomospira entomophilus]